LSSPGLAVRRTASLPLAYAGRSSIPETVRAYVRHRGVLDAPRKAGHDDGRMRLRILATRSARVLHEHRPSKTEGTVLPQKGSRESRVCPMHPRPRVRNKKAHELYYSYEIAKATATRVVAFAREHGHPLQYVIERKPLHRENFRSVSEPKAPPRCLQAGQRAYGDKKIC